MKFRIFCLFLISSVILTVTLAETLPKCDVDDDTDRCCACYQDIQESCNNTCPHDYLKIMAAVTCDIDPDLKNVTTEATTTTTTPTPTTTSPPTTSFDISSNFSDDSNRSSSSSPRGTTITDLPPTITVPVQKVVVCIKSCDKGTFYDVNGLDCVSCDKACRACNGSGSDNCTTCTFMHNNRCVANCPEKTVVKNGSVCVDDGTGDDSSNLPMYIGVGVGSGLVVVVVIVVVIYVLRRRATPTARGNGQQRGSTVISRLVEEKEEQTIKEEQTVKPKSRHGDYQNTSTLPGNITQQIEFKHDEVRRYTDDPTAKPAMTNRKSPANQRETSKNEDDIDRTMYGNEALVKLQEKKDTASMTPEEIEELLMFEELGDAPSIPSNEAASKLKAAPFVSGAKIMRPKEKPKADIVEPEEEEEYIEMEVGVDNEAMDHLEDYENSETFHRLSNQAHNNPRKSTPAQSSTQTKPPSKSKSDEPKTSDEDLDDYENTTKYKKTSVELEDYENMPAKPPGGDIYENITFATKK